jgi:hypothetical protein
VVPTEALQNTDASFFEVCISVLIYKPAPIIGAVNAKAGILLRFCFGIYFRSNAMIKRLTEYKYTVSTAASKTLHLSAHAYI